MLYSGLLLVLMAFPTQGQDTLSSSSSSSSSLLASLRQTEPVLKPKTLPILSGQEAHFNCTATSWTFMVWSVDGNSVIVIEPSNGPLNSTEPYSARQCTPEDTFCWTLVIKEVSRDNDINPQVVTCDIGNSRKSSAELFVQESGSAVIRGGNATVPIDQTVALECLAYGWFPEPSINWFLDDQQVDQSDFNITRVVKDATSGLFNITTSLDVKVHHNVDIQCQVSVSAMAAPLSINTSLSAEPLPRDYTVVIAVVCSVLGVLLLIFLGIGVALCLKKKRLEKEPPKQNNTSREQHQNNPYAVAEETEGHVNQGFTEETSSNFTETDTNVSTQNKRATDTTVEMPDVVPVYGNGKIYYIATNRQGSGQTLRRVTIV